MMLIEIFLSGLNVATDYRELNSLIVVTESSIALLLTKKPIHWDFMAQPNMTATQSASPIRQ